MKLKLLFTLMVLLIFSGCLKTTTNKYSIIGSWEITITTQDNQVHTVYRRFDGTQRSGDLYSGSLADSIGQYRLDNLGVTFSTTWTDFSLAIQVSNRYKGKFTSQDEMAGTLNQVYIDKEIAASWKARRL